MTASRPKLRALPTYEPPHPADPVSHLSSLVAEIADLVADRVGDRLVEQLEQHEMATSPWLDLDAVCEYTGLSRDAIYKLTAARAIPVRKRTGGQGLRFHRDEVEMWMTTYFPRVDHLG